jgi:hypothetical protein
LSEDEFKLEPMRQTPTSQAVLAGNSSVSSAEPVTPDSPLPATPDDELNPQHEPVNSLSNENESQRLEPEPAPMAQPAPKLRTAPVLTQGLNSSQEHLPNPQIKTPTQPIFGSNQLFSIVEPQPEIMPEPEPIAAQPAKTTKEANLIATKPEPKPATPAPAAKPTAPAPATKPAAPAPKPEADESLDVDISLDEADEDDDIADEGMDSVEGLMDDDRDGFIDESDSSERELNSLFGDEDDDLDFDEDDDLDIGDF